MAMSLKLAAELAAEMAEAAVTMGVAAVGRAVGGDSVELVQLKTTRAIPPTKRRMVARAPLRLIVPRNLVLEEVTDAALAFEGTSKRYRRGTLALDDVTWSIPLGAKACLLGPNGAGKSTAIRLLEGAIAPTKGKVTLLGAQAGRPGYSAARRRTGVVPQSAGMYSDLTTAEYLELARRLYRRGDPSRFIEAFGLGPFRDLRLARLSGGFQRRAVLAAALLAEPEVLLLDEPTVGLDPLAAHEVHAFLVTLMAGRTTLLCTHNLAEAEALCDEVVILREGRVLLHEPLATLRHRSRVRTRLAATQGAAPLEATLNARGIATTRDGDGVLADFDARAAGPQLLRDLLAGGIDVYECHPVQATLEDLFLQALGQSQQ